MTSPLAERSAGQLHLDLLVAEMDLRNARTEFGDLAPGHPRRQLVRKRIRNLGRAVARLEREIQRRKGGA